MPPAVGKKVASLTVLESPDQVRRSVWLQMVRTVHLVERQVSLALARHDLTLPQFDVLATLRFAEGLTQQELAERLLVSKGNVVGLLNRLAEGGYVERRPDAKDARANRLFLTAKARRKVEAIVPEHDRLIGRLFAQLPLDAAKSLRTALRKIDEMIDTE